VVSILADNEALAELGLRLEPHPGPQQVIGLHELAVRRLLLDTCATVAEAREALLSIKAGTVEVSFYLGEEEQADGTRYERRSDYLTVALDAS